MTTLQIRNELAAHGLVDTVTKYALKHRRHGKHSNLVLFKYDQIDSPVGDPVVWDCRALILDQENDWAPVAFPYRRFFNHGEIHAPALDWSKTRVYEKEDGSLITLYWYAGQWHASTSGTPDGSSVIAKVYDKTAGQTMTFAEKFFSVIGQRLPHGDEHMCFMFELCAPENRVVVEHKHARAVLHGARDMRTLKEVDPIPYAEKYGWEMCRSYPMRTIEEIMAAAEHLKPNESEGYVAWDGENRQKVKAPQYVALHHVANGNSPRRMLEMVRMNESAEWLAYFPNMRQLHDDVRTRYESLIAGLESEYSAIKHIESQKEFAEHAKRSRCSGALFKMRQGKSIRQFFADYNIKNLCALVGVSGDDAEAE